jgi:hypothetical protein
MKEISFMHFPQYGEVFYFYVQALHASIAIPPWGRQRLLSSTCYDPYTPFASPTFMVFLSVPLKLLIAI